MRDPLQTVRWTACLALVAWTGCAPGDDVSDPTPGSNRRLSFDANGASAWVTRSDWHRAELPQWPEEDCPRRFHARESDPPLLVRSASLFGLPDAGGGECLTSPDDGSPCWQLAGGFSVLHWSVRVPERTPLVLRAKVRVGAGDGFSGLVICSWREESEIPDGERLAARWRDAEARTFRDLFVGHSPLPDGAQGVDWRPPEVLSRSTDGVEVWRLELAPTMFGTRSLSISAVHGLEAQTPGQFDLYDLELFDATARACLGRNTGGSTLEGLPDLRSVDLERRMALVRRDGESRRALLLPAGGTAEVAMPAGSFEPGVLRFGFCVVPEARLCHPNVVHETWVGIGQRQHGRGAEPFEPQRLCLRLDERSPHGWQSVELRVEPERGDFTIEIEVEGVDSPGGELVAVSEPIFVPDQPQAQPPFNLVVVSLDTLRADRVGRTVAGESLTPFLDELASRSWVFDQALANSSYTLPSHVSLFTGQYPSEHGMLHPVHRLDLARSPVFTPLLAERGWATAAFTAGAMLNAEFCGIHHGFDRYHEIDPCLSETDPLWERVPRWYAPEYNRSLFDQATLKHNVLPWMERHRTVPFFLFLHTYLVHDYHPRGELADRFAPRGVDAAAAGPPLWESGEGATGVTATSLTRIDPDSLSRERDLPYLEGLYDATVRQADERVAELWNALEQLELTDRTIFVVTSDHGEEFLEHGGLGHARTLYEEMLRVPLIVHVPGQPARAWEQPVEGVDVAPTLLSLLGVGADALPTASGRDLAAEARREGVTQHEGLVVRADGYRALRALRCASVKSISSIAAPAPSADALSPVARNALIAQGYLEEPGPRDASAAASSIEYFDLNTDPGERSPRAWDELPPAGRKLLEGAANEGGPR